MELHNASLRPDTLKLDNLMDLMDEIQRTLCEHSLQSNMYKTTGFMVLQLLLLIGKHIFLFSYFRKCHSNF